MRNFEVDRILQIMLAAEQNVSDLHFYVGRPPQVEVSGLLRPAPIKGLERLTPFHVDFITMCLMMENPDAVQRFKRSGAADFSYSIPGISRFRANAYRQRGSISLVMRVIPYGVPTIKDLSLPVTLHDIAEETNGIILVTGATGNGKSTTIAAIIEEINQKHAYHIVTIEDPIEYMYRHGQASICQRELGSDTESFAGALRAALRQSPKVIVVGEMRDVETAEIALEAAETGHLVFSTLHTIDSSKAIDRLIGLFPKAEEQQLRKRFAQAFRFVLAQRLIPKTSGGRIPVVEILKSTPRTREYIVKGEGDGRSLLDAMNDGFLEGMQSFDQELQRMVRAGIIEKEVAFRYSTNPNNLALNLQTVPGEERMPEVWQDLLNKEELTPADISRIPDVIHRITGDVNPDDVEMLTERVVGHLTSGESYQKLAVLQVLPALTSILIPIKSNDSTVLAQLPDTLEICFGNEADEDVLFAFVRYLRDELLAAWKHSNQTHCTNMVEILKIHLPSKNRLARHFAEEIDRKDGFAQKGLLDPDWSDLALQYIRLCGEKGAEFLFNWLAEEPDRSTRIKLLGWICRLDAGFIAPQIEKRLLDYRWYVTRNMITILTKVDLPQTRQLIKEVLNHEDVRVIREIMKKLYQDPSLSDASMINRYLQHEDKTIRIQAIHLAAMASLQSAVPTVMKYAGTQVPADTDLRTAALQALVKLHVREALPLAQKVLERKPGSKVEVPERNAAVKLIGELGNTAFQPLLKKLATTDPHQETRDAAGVYLK